MTRKYVVAFGLICPLASLAVTIGPNPLCTVRSPDSILDRKEQYKPLFVGNRQRWATCTGAAWFHDNYLAVLNLYGEQLCTYRFNKEQNSFHLLQQIKKQPEALLKMPENLAVSPDGTVLAICNSVASTLNLYAIDRETHLINPVPLLSLPADSLVHNVRFSPDGSYFAYASFKNEESVRIYRLKHTEESINAELVYTEESKRGLMKTKAINFTKDCRYVVIAYALSIRASVDNPFESLLVTRTFNQDGTLGATACATSGTFSIEDIAFTGDDRNIIASDQGSYRIIIYPFDPSTGQIDQSYSIIQNPEAQLSFPHGITISQDGKHLVITNYGTDTFNLYHVQD